MPPRRGSPPSSTRPSSPAPAVNPDHSNITISTTQTDADPARYAFYGTTFTLHRVSPLFLGSSDGATLSEPRLHILAQRLRDVLVGDVVRGVEVGLAAGSSDNDNGGNKMAGMGGLEAVVMRRVDAGDLLDVNLERLQEQFEDGDGGEDLADLWGSLQGRTRGKQGLVMELMYENSVCVALLLPDLSKSQSSSSSYPTTTKKRKKGSFLWLPLMLMRMPAPLKVVVAEFLAAEFDCKVGLNRVGTRTMVGGLERWIGTVATNKREQRKDLLVGLGFNVLPMLPKQKLDGAGGDGNGGDKEKPGLTTVDVIIPWQDLSLFVKTGQEMEQDEIERRYEEGGVGYDTRLKEQRLALAERLAGRLSEEGWGWRDEGQQPFTEALSEYTKRIMALKLYHPAVRMIKVACSGFVMAGGKLKIFETIDRAAVVDLLGAICEKAMAEQVE